MVIFQSNVGETKFNSNCKTRDFSQVYTDKSNIILDSLESEPITKISGRGESIDSIPITKDQDQLHSSHTVIDIE